MGTIRRFIFIDEFVYMGERGVSRWEEIWLLGGRDDGR